jgi:hypothetical protein
MPNSVVAYSVRTEFAGAAVRDRYVDWLRDEHCLAMVREGGALSAEVTVLHDGAVEARYLFASPHDYELYRAGPARGLDAERELLFPAGSDVATTTTVGTRVVRIPD